MSSLSRNSQNRVVLIFCQSWSCHSLETSATDDPGTGGHEANHQGVPFSNVKVHSGVTGNIVVQKLSLATEYPRTFCRRL